MIIIQFIETKWTKQSRGMPGAAMRNRVPRALELPSLPVSFDGIFVHSVRAHESNDFLLEQNTECLDSINSKFWHFRIKQEEDSTRIIFTYDSSYLGQPERKGYKNTPIFTLATGEKSIFHINGRHTFSIGQWYTQHFINIASIDTAKPSLFTEGKPDYILDEMANLF